jgi:PBP1b-binding outer membrane lipoprotein LpoB
MNLLSFDFNRIKMRTRNSNLCLIIIIGAFFINSCNQKKHQNQSKSANIDIAQTIWYVDFKTPNSFASLKRSECLDTLLKSPEKLINEINKKFPKVGLELMKVSNDTIYLNIINSEVLTETMGTMGADEYLAITTYTLTEIESIKNVSFEMIDGTHAGKGVMTRNTFKTRFEIKQ